MSGYTATKRTGAAVRPRRLIQTIVSLALLAAILLIVFRQSDSAALSRTALDISAGPLAHAFGASPIDEFLGANATCI